MGLREKQLGERRRHILDVADRLVRETGGTDFSMRMLATLSDVSPATPYNLFSSKDGVLAASLARSLKAISAEALVIRSTEPLDFLIHATRVAVNRIVADEELMRPLYRYLLGVAETQHRPYHIKSSLHFWRTVAENAGGYGLGLAECDALSHMLFAHFRGLLELWIHRDVDANAFMARATHGGLLIISSFVPASRQPALQERLTKAWIAFEDALRPKIHQMDEETAPLLVGGSFKS